MKLPHDQEKSSASNLDEICEGFPSLIQEVRRLRELDLEMREELLRRFDRTEALLDRHLAALVEMRKEWSK